MEKSLQEIYEKYKTEGVGWGDKGSGHSYIEVYAKLFSPYRENATHVLEVGVCEGHSLRMWKEYFPNALIHGVDIALSCRKYAKEGFVIYTADSREIRKYLGKIEFQIIIDDGDHNLPVQLATFEQLFSFVAEGGLYVIEDVSYLDSAREPLKALHPSCEIVDRRHVKGRDDDVLAIYRK